MLGLAEQVVVAGLAEGSRRQTGTEEAEADEEDEAEEDEEDALSVRGDELGEAEGPASGMSGGHAQEQRPALAASGGNREKTGSRGAAVAASDPLASLSCPPHAVNTCKC